MTPGSVGLTTTVSMASSLPLTFNRTSKFVVFTGAAITERASICLFSSSFGRFIHKITASQAASPMIMRSSTKITTHKKTGLKISSFIFEKSIFGIENAIFFIEKFNFFIGKFIFFIIPLLRVGTQNLF